MRILLLTAGLLFSGAATAQTGADLLKYCRSDNPAELVGCELYVAGFVQGFSLANLRGKICLPKTITGDQAVGTFVQFLHEIEVSSHLGQTPGPDVNPFFTEPQGTSLAAVLAMTFPCRKKQ